MANIYNVDSPINREQRNNLNETFRDIQNRFSNLRLQIALLSGGEDLEAIIQRIESTISNAEQTTANTEQTLQQISDALSQLQTALQNSEEGTNNANEAANSVRNEITNLQSFVNQIGNANSYDNNQTYKLNNIIEYNGSSFIAIQETTGNIPPTLPLKRNDYWQLLAQRGIDGQGSVSSVNNIGPDVNGNIELTPLIIGAPEKDEFDSLNNSFNNFKGNTFVNIKDFGAIGDGIADDTTSINNAINSLIQNNVGGGTVFIPVGSYRLTSSINLRNGIILKGATPQGSRLFADANDFPIVISREASRVSIEDLRIDGAGRTGIYGIALYDATGIRVKNVWIDSATRGIYINNTYFVELETLRIVGSQIAYEMLNAANVINMKNCYSITTERALEWTGSSSLIVNGCSFEGRSLVRLRRVQGATFHGCYWEGLHEESDIPTFVEVGGINDNSAKGISFKGNYFLIKAQYGITLYGCEGISIEGNFFGTSVGGVAIYQYDQAPKKDIKISANSYDIGNTGYDITKAVGYLGEDFDSLNTNINEVQIQPLMFVAQKTPQDSSIELNSTVLYWNGTNLMLKIKDSSGSVSTRTVSLS